MTKAANWHFDLNPNIGIIDKSIRYVTGAALIGSVLILTPITLGWLAILPLIAIPIVITAIIGWDPIYALFQKSPTAVFSFLKKKASDKSVSLEESK